MECIGCQNNILKPVLKLDDSYVAMGYSEETELSEIRHPLHIYLCERCGLLQQQVNEPLLRIVQYCYENNYNLGSPPGLGYLTYSLQQKILYWYEALNKPKKTLEIGCNDGYLLKLLSAKYNNAQFIGVDPAVETTCLDNLAMIKGWFPKDVSRNDKYGFIYSINVLEHIPNPSIFLDNVRECLSKNGFFLFRVPEATQSLKYGDISLAVHQHFSYFTLTSLQRLLKDAGLYIRHIDLINSEVWVICCKIKSTETYGDVSQTTKQCNTYKMMLHNNIEQIRKYLMSKNKYGFYGASVIASLLSFFSVEELNTIIFDSDPFKQMKYIRGSLLGPIYPFEEKWVSENNLKNIIILPLHFQEEIKQYIDSKRLDSVKAIKVFKNIKNMQLNL